MVKTRGASLFESYPKIRPPLPKEIEDIYAAHFRANREGQTTATSLAQKMESWMHRQVARDVARPGESRKATLELGAGTLNQLQYEPDVQPYDIVEPFTGLYEGSHLLSRVRNVYSDILAVPATHRYDRVTSVATLEHVPNLPEVVARSGLLLAENGTFRAGIPSEGTPLWTLGWRVTTGLEFKLRYGIDYGVLMRYEHLNTAREIEEVLEYFFEEVECRVFGLARSISLYRYYGCRRPRVARCSEFTTSRGA